MRTWLEKERWFYTGDWPCFWLFVRGIRSINCWKWP